MDAKGSDTIVIHIGSLNLRVGFASQMTPHTIPNVIAYRTDEPVPPAKLPSFDAEALFRACNIVQEYLHSVGYLKEAKPRIVLPRKKSKSKRSEPELEEMGEVEVEVGQDWSWTDTSNHPSYLVGHAAYNLPPNSPYVKHWPILRGAFNINSQQSFQTVLSDLSRILEYTIIVTLHVAREMFSQYSVLLIVPDYFIKSQVKGVIDVILRSLGFRSVFLLQESVAALYGSGVGSACVVDIGAEHINVICVDEGMIVPNSHLIQNIAGRNFDVLLLRLLRPDADSEVALRLAESLKIKASRLVQPENETIFVWNIEGETLRISSMNPALAVTAHSLFHLSLLEIAAAPPRESYRLNPLLDYDHDDYLDDLVESRIDPVPPPIRDKLMSLDQMIIKSITSVATDEVRKKLANCIILCGGGGIFPELLDVLEDRLINRFPEEAGIERVEVKASIIHSDSDGNKEVIPPQNLMWVGGTVVPRLEAAKDLWITRARWLGEWDPTEAKEELRAKIMSNETPQQVSEMCKKWRKDRPLEGGVRHLREKCPFIW